MYHSRRLGAAALVTLLASSASAAVLNFDDQGLTGPSLFASASPQDVNENVGGVDVTLTGGTILTNTTNLPGNATSVYGTADFFSGGLNPLTLTFSSAISNFFLDVFNGNTVEQSFEVADNAGNSAIFTLDDNLSGGFQTIGFAATGTEVTITALDTTSPGCCAFDFFVDNITFNEDLPPNLNPVPIPATLPLLFGGLALFGFVSRRKS